MLNRLCCLSRAVRDVLCCLSQDCQTNGRSTAAASCREAGAHPLHKQRRVVVAARVLQAAIHRGVYVPAFSPPAHGALINIGLRSFLPHGAHLAAGPAGHQPMPPALTGFFSPRRQKAANRLGCTWPPCSMRQRWEPWQEALCRSSMQQCPGFLCRPRRMRETLLRLFARCSSLNPKLSKP